MPRQAEWLQHVPAALKALEHVTTPVIDRAMLGKLLRIHRRAAIRLMHRFGGYQAGRNSSGSWSNSPAAKPQRPSARAAYG